MLFDKWSTNRRGDSVRVSKCGNFTIIRPCPENRPQWFTRPSEKYFVRELASIYLGPCLEYNDAVIYCTEHEAIKPQVMVYFRERAEYEIQISKAKVADPNWLRGREPTLFEESVIRQAEASIDAEAERLYRYLKQSAFARSTKGHHLDYAAHLEWGAMVDGKYIHPWQQVPSIKMTA